jgi:hypothetical protein
MARMGGLPPFREAGARALAQIVAAAPARDRL